jgi:hypothetical protein
MPADEMYSFVKNIVFDFIKNQDENSDFADSLSDAIFEIPNA